MTDTDLTEQEPAAPEPAQPGPGARALREALERSQAREAEAQERAARIPSLEDENSRLRRLLGVVQAGVDPDSTFGKGIVATAEASGITAPDDVRRLALVMQAEARGELPPTNGHRSEDASD